MAGAIVRRARCGPGWRSAPTAWIRRSRSTRCNFPSRAERRSGDRSVATRVVCSRPRTSLQETLEPAELDELIDVVGAVHDLQVRTPTLVRFEEHAEAAQVEEVDRPEV